MDRDPESLGWPAVIHRAYIPNEHSVTRWPFDDPPTSGLSAVLREDFLEPPDFRPPAIFFALEEPAPIPIAGDAALQLDPGPEETRLRSRVVCHPSGELPRLANYTAVGSINGEELPAIVDEVVFGSDRVDLGPQAVLAAELSLGSADGLMFLDVGRYPWGDVDLNLLSQYPEEAALVRIGDELVVYDRLNRQTGEFDVGPGGRGVLGSIETSHARGESVTLLDHLPVATLAAAISADDATLPLTTTRDFPNEGTVRIGDELLHYTRRRDGSLQMPEASTEPGQMDRRGQGIFRGRFGTAPSGHVAGTPVILHPFRYWDRGAERADGPELSYLGFTVDQPNAFWRGLFWEEESPAFGGSYLEILARTDPATPWDAEPGTLGLQLYEAGSIDSGGAPIGQQSNRLEVRVVPRFQLGAYDPLGGLSHGWKETPRLRMFGVQYLAPGTILRRVDL